MNFKCKNLSVLDDELSLTIIFSDIGEQERHSIDTKGKYLLLQKVYPEDEFEDIYYSIELSDFNKSGELKKFNIQLDMQAFQIEWNTNSAKIELNIEDEKFNELVKALKSFTAFKGNILIS